MKQITLYHSGMPIVHHPIEHSPVHIGTEQHNDLILASDRLADCRVTIEEDEQGKWFSSLQSSNARLPKRREMMEPGKRIALGEYQIALTQLPQPTANGPETFGMIGNSAAIQHLRYEIRRLAPLSGSVLIEGESGTGKELTARALHLKSKRSHGPFIAINCGGITESMAEDIFFGHEKGAFTGAGTTHKGAFERAHNGTLFLDEIGELPLAQQATLLRVLDNGFISRIGSEQAHHVQFRLVCATNRNLLDMIAEKSFRIDLYHRISALQLSTPPLRHRPHDIRLLAEHFLQEFRGEVGPKRLTREAQDRLRNQRWNGNCRELRNVLYKAAALHSSVLIRANELALTGSPRQSPRMLADQCILEELTKVDGNVTAAAKSLGIPRTSLRNRLRKLKQA
ncbi:MAG: sigma-54-dependent Fis family transcriptional regulator [Deltaproteobacteria bacterium]|nr:sigma-54-dependent Fis family transcriptional regulator [Deltaproteobacteria bacterium]MBN2670428.1 sigma-54-dependent Fis family transcriptional regulator [Deltaproteobacteria bacterium]